MAASKIRGPWLGHSKYIILGTSTVTYKFQQAQIVPKCRHTIYCSKDGGLENKL